MNRAIPFFFLLLLIVVATVFLQRQRPAIPFESEAWKAWIEQEDNIEERWSMARNLVRSRQLIGKTQQEVVALLGPAGTHRMKPPLAYNTGPCLRGFFTIDYSVLVVEFEEDKVASVRIECH